jgi:hypothetical protein
MNEAFDKSAFQNDSFQMESETGLISSTSIGTSLMSGEN